MSGRMVSAEEARAMLDGATEGPWRWYGNTASRQIYLATVDRGRQFVLSFFRWGMQGATPALRGDGHMENAERFARYEVAPDATDASDRRLYRHDFQGLRHPDATLIEAAPDLAHTVVVQAEQIAELQKILGRCKAVSRGPLSPRCTKPAEHRDSHESDEHGYSVWTNR